MANRNPKGQHFLLSSASKDLSVIELAMKNDDECRDMFAKIRWSNTNGTPVCPHCGTVDNYWFLLSTKRYKCKSCKKSYSITTNTIFADRKMSFKQYLVAIFLFANKVKGSSMVELVRTMKVNYKTIFLLSHKIRASIIDTQDEEQFDGVCEIDAVHTNMPIRPKNNISDRVDRRKEPKPNKRVIVVTKLRAKKFILTALRTDNEPLKTIDVTLSCQRAKNISTENKETNKAVGKIIVETLRQLEKGNLVEAIGKDGLSLIWKIKD